MKPLTPAQQRVVDVMKRIAFVIFYLVWLFPSIYIAFVIMVIAGIYSSIKWVFTGKFNEDISDLFFAPIIFPYTLFGYK